MCVKGEKREMGKYNYTQVEEVTFSKWMWVAGFFSFLVLLAVLGVTAATLGIVDKNENKWKGEHANINLGEIEKRFERLNGKIDWIKEDLKELDDIEEGLWWISKHLKRSSSSSDSEDHHHRDKNRVCPVRRGYHLLFCDPYDGTQGVYDPSTGCPYFYFADPTLPFVGDDGNITQNFKKGYISVDSMPYTLTVPQSPAGVLDHVKYLNYETIPKFVGEHEILRSDTIMDCVTDPGSVPFPSSLVTDPNRDIRLASCAANAIDLTTLLVFDWFMTGPKNGERGIKGCFYERLPIFQNCTNPEQPECYRAFSSFNITGSRYKDDKEYLSIEYDRKAGEVRWYDRGELVCRTGHLGTPNPGFILGLDHGGNNKIIDMTQLSIGFGDFTLLDMRDFLNPNGQTGLVKLDNVPGFYKFPCETCFYDLQGKEQNRLFGEGAKFNVYHTQSSIGNNYVF